MNPLKTKCPHCHKERTLHVIQPDLKCPDCGGEVIKFHVNVKYSK